MMNYESNLSLFIMAPSCPDAGVSQWHKRQDKENSVGLGVFVEQYPQKLETEASIHAKDWGFSHN